MISKRLIACFLVLIAAVFIPALQPLFAGDDQDENDDEDDHIPFYKTIGITGTEVFFFKDNKTFEYDEYQGYQNNLNVLFSKDIYSLGLTFRYEYYTEELGERKNRNRLHKKFFQINTMSFAATVGDFYTSLGKGLLVSILKDDLVEVDTSVEGGKLVMNTGRFSGQFMGGRIYELEADLTHYIGGARVTSELPGQSILGAGFVYFEEDPDLVTEEKTFLVGPSFEMTGIHDICDIYAEYVHIERELSSDTITGHGAYFSTTFYYDTWTFLAEYKDYYKFNFQYNLPPTLDREDEPTTQEDERGTRFVLSYNWPGSPNNIYIGRVDFNARDTDEFTINTYVGAQFFDIWDKVYLEVFSSVRETFEKIFKFSVDSSFKLNEKNSLQFHYKHESTNYHDANDNDQDDFYLGFSRSPWLITTVMWQHSRDKILEKHSLWGFESEIKPADSFSFKIFAGSRKGGLVCSSGVCRVVDPFEGVEVRLEYRF